MVADRQLSANFRLSRMPCWERASEDDVARLRETVARVLQPARDRWGAIVVSSWRWWRDGCTPRSGAHAGGGTVDIVPFGAPAPQVFEWLRRYIVPAGYVGRLIYEPDWWRDGGDEPAGPGDVKVQGEHIHIAPRRDMADAGLPDDVGVYEETQPGSYAYVGPGPVWGGHTGAWGDPIPIEGFVATVSPTYKWLALLAIAAAAVAISHGRTT